MDEATLTFVTAFIVTLLSHVADVHYGSVLDTDHAVQSHTISGSED